MAQLVEYLGDEQLNVALIAEQDKKKLLVSDARGRRSKLPPDKVLFRHSAASIEELSGRLDALQRDVDVPLLWETLVAEEDVGPREAVELARVYFDDDSEVHASAVFRALLAERLHFRRRGRTFEPRSAEELEQLRQQRESEERAERELAELSAALKKKPGPEHCQRLERFLRHGGDRQLVTVLEGMGRDPAREAFNLLLRAGHLPRSADMEVIQANLKPALPEEVIAHAAGLELPADHPAPLSSSFSIDDPETREVDDALSVRQEGELVRVDVDIADVATLVRSGDPVDVEAQRRATTVYLPTGTYLMLPERLGCDLLSLHAGQPRSALRTTAWIDAQGEVQRYELSRTTVSVERRLNYEGADALLARGPDSEDPTAEALVLLDRTARLLAARRRAAGSLSFQQREFKIHVSADGEEITVKPIPHSSPSRALVAEMMILTNGLAARFAEERGIPIIYRVQPPPADKPPDIDPGDPAAFAKLRGLLAPATLSLQPAKHCGLGLEGYTQASSPLRRYTDLVIQRQLQAGLSGETPPYTAEGLLKVLATAEATERETQRLEATVPLRWALEHVSRLEDRASLSAWVLDAVAGGYKAMLCCCGATGLLLDSAPREPGERVTVAVKSIKPRQGGLRMVPA